LLSIIYLQSITMPKEKYTVWRVIILSELKQCNPSLAQFPSILFSMSCTYALCSAFTVAQSKFLLATYHDLWFSWSSFVSFIWINVYQSSLFASKQCFERFLKLIHFGYNIAHCSKDRGKVIFFAVAANKEYMDNKLDNRKYLCFHYL
jgi:hypothetical protein